MAYPSCSACGITVDCSDLAQGPRIKEGPNAGLYENIYPPLCCPCHEKQKSREAGLRGAISATLRQAIKSSDKSEAP